MALEQHEGSLVIWCTSELPLSYELIDWFIEIPVQGRDYILQSLNTTYGLCMDWSMYFDNLVDSWSKKPMTLARVQEVRDWVYFCLQKNLRWQEVIQYLLDALLQSKLEPKKIMATIEALSKQPSSGGGNTLGSYRIPIAWEHLGLQLAKALST